jgi:hypothetical protein
MDSCTINNTNDLFLLCPQLDAVCTKPKDDDIWSFTLSMSVVMLYSSQIQTEKKCPNRLFSFKLLFFLSVSAVLNSFNLY